MKTILVVYTNVRLDKKAYVSMKQYSFNTAAKLKVGDLVKSPDYDTAMQVVEVLPKAYKYVNLADGKLSDKRDSTRQFEIRHLVLTDKREEASNVVKASRVRPEELGRARYRGVDLGIGGYDPADDDDQYPDYR